MKAVTKRFIEITENQLEGLIHVGLLKSKNAYKYLCNYTFDMRKKISQLENIDDNEGPFNNIPVKRMLLLVVASLIALY